MRLPGRGQCGWAHPRSGPRVAAAGAADATLEDGERYYFAYDERWRMVASFRNQDASPKETFVYHAAGRQGYGGSSSIDSVILRDRDEYTSSTPNPWTSASDGTLEERRFYLQNWRADVVAVVKDDGTPWEYIRYSSYGEPTSYPVADINRDGVVDEADAEDWVNIKENAANNAAVAADLNRNGEGPGDDSGDSDLFDESYTAHTGMTGKGRLSAGGIGSGSPTGTFNRKGYAGYEWDPVISMYHVRHRVYHPEIGRWTRRDPLGSIVGGFGPSDYVYVNTSPVSLADPSGLIGVPRVERMGCHPVIDGPEESTNSNWSDRATFDSIPVIGSPLGMVVTLNFRLEGETITTYTCDGVEMHSHGKVFISGIVSFPRVGLDLPINMKGRVSMVEIPPTTCVHTWKLRCNSQCRFSKVERPGQATCSAPNRIWGRFAIEHTVEYSELGHQGMQLSPKAKISFEPTATTIVFSAGVGIGGAFELQPNLTMGANLEMNARLWKCSESSRCGE